MTELFKTVQLTKKTTPDNRKQSSFFCVLHMIRASFMINRFNFCDPFIKILEREKDIDLNSLPKNWQVQIAYYQGRYHMYNNSFDKARVELRKAFSLCHKDNMQNKQRILRFLIPVEMLAGKFPS